MKKIALCADDFALHPAVDAAVVTLAQVGRLTATSCMSTAPRWPEAALLLPPLRPALQVGLHFNLTEGHGRSAPSLGQTLLRAYTGQLRPALMAQALHQQLDAFEEQLGTPPDFIDGHQHVHQLPGVRAALLQVLRQRYGTVQPPWVRSTMPAQLGLNKATALAVLGGWQLKRQLARVGLRHPRAFAGVYGFDAATPAAYGVRMAQWLEQASEGTLLMCHPATVPVPGDAIGTQRAVEYAYLASPEFAALLQRLGVVLAHNENWP